MAKMGVVLYGVGGVDTGYAVIRYHIIDGRDVSVDAIDREAGFLRADNPGVKQVFVIDNRYQLRNDYREAVRTSHYSGWIVFKDILERQGVEWPNRV